MANNTPSSSSNSNGWSILLLILVILLGIGSMLFAWRIGQRMDEMQVEMDRMQEELEQLRIDNQQLREQIENASKAGVAERVSFRGHTFDTYVVSLREMNVRLYWQGKDSTALRNLGRLKTESEERGEELLFGMNAGMYNPNFSPQGLYIENGQMLVPIDESEGSGNFYLKPNGVFLLREKSAAIIETSQFSTQTEGIQYATQSGPMLLIDGKIHPEFREGSSNLHIRNGVGIISSDKIIFAISNQPVNFFDFASLFRERFGCENALYLDGAISKMYLPALDRADLGGNLGPLIGILPR